MKNINLTGSNVLLEWKESDEGALQLPEELKAQINAQNNGVTKALAVGPDCKTIKEGDWVLLNGAGRLLVLDGITYGMVKEHQIDATFKAKPRLGKNELDSFSNIKIEKTAKKVEDFNIKHNL
jgi:hypothetical protein